MRANDDNDRKKPHLCRKCKTTLNTSTDRKKTRAGWWTNCQSCRGEHAEKWRQKRGSSASQTSEPTHSLPKEQSQFGEKTGGSQCAECGERPHRPWRTNCRHLLCGPCYEGVLNAAAGLGQTQPICKACGQYFSFCTPCEYEEDAKPVYKRKRTLEDEWRGKYSEGSRNKYPKEATPAPETTECSVCGESVLAKDQPKLPACTHEPDICTQCFNLWLEQQMESISWEKIRCPSNDCDQTMTHADINNNASADLFNR